VRQNEQAMLDPSQGQLIGYGRSICWAAIEHAICIFCIRAFFQQNYCVDEGLVESDEPFKRFCGKAMVLALIHFIAKMRLAKQILGILTPLMFIKRKRW